MPRALVPIPGFVDLQVNGFRGVDFSSPRLTETSLAEVCAALAREGTAAFLPTIITSAVSTYRRNLPLIARVIAGKRVGGCLLGIHLEGPFISPEPGAVGAHAPRWVRPPDIALLDSLIEWSAGTLRLLTVAPERPGALKLIEHAVRAGLVVSLGHTMADESVIGEAVAAGATAFTHFGNGLPHLVPRHRNPLWAVLADDRLSAMIITDGHHLTRSVIATVVRAKGVQRTIVVSDASPIAGLPPGRYRASGNRVVLEPDGRLHNPVKGCLVGSSATMLTCVNYLGSLGLLGRDQLLTVGLHNPRRLLGLRPGRICSQSTVWYDNDSGRFVTGTEKPGSR